MGSGQSNALSGPVKRLPAASVVELLRRVAESRPAAVAIEEQGHPTTFRTLWRRAGCLADAMTEAGVRPGDRVALWAERTADVIAAALAAMSVRACYVPIDPTFPETRVQAIVDRADPALFVHHGRCALPAGVATMDTNEVTATRPRGPRPLPHAEDIAYVIFTSGSTGSPKGVRIEHRSLTNYSCWCASLFRGGGLGSPLFGSLGFDHSMSSLWPTLVRGERVRLVAGVWDQEAIFRPGSRPYGLVKVTPSHLRFFARTGATRYRDVTRLLVIGGEALDPALITSAPDRYAGVRLVNHYGPTEATVGCCHHEFDTTAVPDLASVPIGRPIWNTRAYLVDDRLRPCGPGVSGELVVAGHGVARGYLGGGGADEAFLDERLLGGPPCRAYRTGDLAELLPDGTLRYIGRRDGQLKVNGYRVEPGELRRHALGLPGVADVAFHLDQGDMATLEALVVPNDEAGSDLAGVVRRSLADALPPAVVPRRVWVVPELVMNANGKCDVRATRLRASRAADSLPR